MKKRIVFAFVLFILFVSLVLVSSQTIDKEAVSAANAASSGLKEDVKAEVNQTFTIVKGVIGGFFDKLGTEFGDFLGRIAGWKTLSGEVKLRSPPLGWIGIIFLLGGLVGLFIGGNKGSIWKKLWGFLVGGSSAVILIVFLWTFFTGVDAREYLYTGLALSGWIFIGYILACFSREYYFMKMGAQPFGDIVPEVLKSIRNIFLSPARPINMRLIRGPSAPKVWAINTPSIISGGAPNPFATTYKTTWLETLGNAWWNYLWFVGFYPAVMQFVPLINRIISVISTEAFGSSWILVSIVLAFEIGFIPALIIEFSDDIKRMKYYKAKYLEASAKKLSEVQMKEYSKMTDIRRWGK